MKMGNQAFRALYSEMRDAIGNREALAGMDYSRIPDAAAISEWSAGTEGTFTYGVQLGLREVGGADVRISHHWVVTDTLISPDEAMQQAISEAEALSSEHDSFGKVVVLGGVVSSINRMTGRKVG